MEILGSGGDAVAAAHVANIGRMVEDMELRMRNAIQVGVKPSPSLRVIS